MKFSILTLFPETFTGFETSIIKKAIEKKLIEIEYINIRDFSKNKHKKVDDTPYRRRSRNGNNARCSIWCLQICKNRQSKSHIPITTRQNIKTNKSRKPKQRKAHYLAMSDTMKE